MIYDIIMPVAARSLPVLPMTIEYVKKHLGARSIIIVASGRFREEILRFAGDAVCFEDEDRLIEGLSYEAVRSVIVKKNADATERTGWYLQQFLKMGYALACNEPYYLVWDSDTVPLRKILMFTDEGRPVFDVKQEYHLPYFRTIEKLFRGTVKKTRDDSFISEHMMIFSEYMRCLLTDVEQNDMLAGKKWYERIIDAIHSEDLSGSGFSEFETYGNYVETRYPGAYHYRQLKTFRRGEELMASNVSEEAKLYVFQNYDTISFENRGSLI